MKVLVVENDSTCRQAFEALLKAWNFSIILVSDTKTAWSVFLQEQPDMVISGWQFPEIDAIQLCRQIRNFNGKRYPYIFVSSEVTQKEQVFSILDAGADDFLAKPVDPLEFRAKLRAGSRIIELERELQERISRLEEANKFISHANEKMKKDFYAVAKIQASLLPSSLPSVPSMEFSWVYKPRDELAGDCLNLFRLDENNLAFYVLDVSGRGTAAALLSVSLARALSPFPSQSTLLKQLIQQPPGYRISSPGEVLTELNKSFPLDIETQQFFTIFYGIIDLQSKGMRYSIAGHPKPLLLRGDSVTMLAGGGYPIGFVDDGQFDENLFQLFPGDRMFVYSDGISEAKNSTGEFFAREGLKECIKLSREKPVKECANFILEAGEKFCGKAGLHDDVSILVLEVKGDN